MKTDLLADRHIGIQEADLPAMLEKIGVKSLDELINKTIPSKIRLKEPLALAAPMTEREFAEHIAGLASLNKIYTSYIGMGWYDTITPAVIQRNVFENPAWYTSYTPYQTEVSQGRLEALSNIWSFVEHTKAQYVILANSDLVTTIDFTDALAQHQSSGADITVIYAKGLYNRDKSTNGCILQIDEENTIKEVLTNPMLSGECNISLDMFIMTTDFLKQVVLEAISKNQKSLIRDLLQARKDDFVFKAYEHKGRFFKIDSLEAYYKANLALLDTDTRNNVFNSEAPIYTKVGDNAPVKYGLESNVKNSLVADGCMIEGTVENCVLFRGVKIAKGAVVRNCVLMQGTEIGEGCNIDAIVADKNVTISENRVLTGSPEYPLYLGKKATI